MKCDNTNQNFNRQINIVTKKEIRNFVAIDLTMVEINVFKQQFLIDFSVISPIPTNKYNKFIISYINIRKRHITTNYRNKSINPKTHTIFINHLDINKKYGKYQE